MVAGRRTAVKLDRIWIASVVLASAAGLLAQNPAPWVIGPFSRPSVGNPVVAPQPASTFEDPILKAPAHWEALHTFNPAAIVRHGKVYVLYRAEDNSGAMEIGGHTSRLGLAKSADGIHFKRFASPVFYPDEDDQKSREWPGGVEDPRIVEREDGTYVLTYTQWNRTTYSVGIATSTDLKHWTKHGPAFFAAASGKYADLKYKSAGILTRVVKDRLIAAKVDGRYWMYWGEGAIHLATSSDLIQWNPVENTRGNLVEVLRPRAGHFDSTFPETGPPPVVTSAGIVVLYNGKNAENGGDPALGPNAYAAGEARFDANNPANLLEQIDEPLLKPELPYEKTGQYAAGTTFAEGLVFFHKQWFLYYGCADSLVAVATAPLQAMSSESFRAAKRVAMETSPLSGSGPVVTGTAVNAAKSDGGFYLKNGDTVVFYGDSITEQNYYNQWVELYTATRFPSMRVHFYGAGVGGDRVTGGGGGPIDQRLERDVFAEKPTVVTVMLGMNDGSYRATTDEIESTYVKGYEHLLGSIHEHAPGARVTLLGPSPFDDVTRPVWFEGGYNGVMEHLADLDKGLAKKYDGTFTNLNPLVVTTLERAQKLDPRVAKLLLPDRVHPDPLAHWVMAEALLRGWNAPSLVSSVSIDARALKATETRHAVVEGVEQANGILKWTETEDSLPLPLTRDNATQALLLDLTDIEQQLDQEPLRVTGLDAGRYSLAIDEDAVGTFSAEELAGGINLADYATPMFHQAQRVSWMVRDRDEAHYIHLRMRVLNENTGAQEGRPDVMQAFENSLEDSIYKEAAPKLHVFALSPAVAAPAQMAQ
jgi:beta-1,2-mannosidase